MASRWDEEPLVVEDMDTPLALPEPVVVQQEKGGCCRGVFQVLRGITVEPMLFLYVVASLMQSTITTNLLLDKECMEKGYTKEVCANLSAHNEAEVQVQRSVTTTQMYLSLVSNLPAVLFALFLGSWSDKHGRKVPMILPLVGSLLGTLVYFVNAYWMELPSSFILLAGVPPALSGGLTTLLMASFAYMSDITQHRARTSRIAFVDMGFSLGAPLGFLLGDVLFYKAGYLGIYSASGALFLTAIIYGIVRVKDTRGPFARHSARVVPQVPYHPRNMCYDLFDTQNVHRVFATTLKPRPDKGRTKVLLLIMALCFMVAEFSDSNLAFLYTKLKFGWGYDQYVKFTVTTLLIRLLVTSGLLPLLSYKLQVDDTVLALGGCASQICGLAMTGLASQPWMLYVSSLVACLGGFPLVITRSLISKIVPEEELGRVFSVLASMESLIPLFFGPLFTVIYNSTLHIFPGTYYFFGAALYMIAEIVFVWVFINRHTVHFPASASATPHSHQEEDVPEIGT